MLYTTSGSILCTYVLGKGLGTFGFTCKGMSFGGEIFRCPREVVQRRPRGKFMLYLSACFPAIVAPPSNLPSPTTHSMFSPPPQSLPSPHPATVA